MNLVLGGAVASFWRYARAGLWQTRRAVRTQPTYRHGCGGTDIQVWKDMVCTRCAARLFDVPQALLSLPISAHSQTPLQAGMHMNSREQVLLGTHGLMAVSRAAAPW